MHINKKSEYAILGALYLACQPKGRFVKVSQISQHGQLPKDLLLKIFHIMVEDNILESKAGVNGGFRLKKEPSDITLLDILKLFESSIFINDCLATDACQKTAHCSMALVWRKLQHDIDGIFQQVTFQSLVDQATRQPTFIPLSNH